MNVWRLVYEGFEPGEEGLREALCALGNGYFCSRGASPQARADDVHYPGTYLAGGYNRLRTEVEGEVVENEDLVNMPNWLPLTFKIGDEDWFDLRSVEVLSYRQDLDIRKGLLLRRIRFRDGKGRRTALAERRLVHMGRPHLAALEIRVTPEDWSGRVSFASALDGRVVNAGVERYQALNNVHLQPMECGKVDDEVIFLKVQTHQSEIRVAETARTRLFLGGERFSVERRTVEEPGTIAQHFELDLREGTETTIEKVVALFTSRDPAVSECGLEARKAVQRAGDFEDLSRSHALAWKQLWDHFAVEVRHDEEDEGDRMGMILNLYTFHLLQTVSMNTMTLDLDVGIPSRGWHGEAYRGHILWDDLFVFPLINLRLPEITKELLTYRYRRLPQARQAAREAGYRGAMYPWQSGSDGREESQRIHLNPRSGRWVPDHSHLQRHVNAAIAFNLYQYYQVTGDTEFMSFYGAEMLLEIARFWASLASYNPDLDRYEIRGVIGPDEYHEGYPEADEPGLDNNAYTNIMAVWVMERAMDLLPSLCEDASVELCEKIDLREEELDLWKDICRKMRVVFHDDGIISQFEGYDRLEEFDWEGAQRKHGDIQRLDRILEADGDTPNRYKLSKQADVLMLFYLLSSEELSEIFEKLGYPFSYDTIPKNIQYYLERTSHGSTLSRVVHSWVLSRSDRRGSWELFNQALQSDICDIQGGTTPEGIHLGAMGGTVDQLQRGYTGMVARGDVLWFNPCLPEEISRLCMRVRYRGHTLRLEITRDKLKVMTRKADDRPIRIGIVDELYDLEPGESREFTL